MGPPGNAACGAIASGGIYKLQEKPESKKEKGRDFNEVRDKEYGNQG